MRSSGLGRLRSGGLRRLGSVGLSRLRIGRLLLVQAGAGLLALRHGLEETRASRAAVAADKEIVVIAGRGGGLITYGLDAHLEVIRAAVAALDAGRSHIDRGTGGILGACGGRATAWDSGHLVTEQVAEQAIANLAEEGGNARDQTGVTNTLAAK